MDVVDWKSYAQYVDGKAHTVVGDVRVLPQFYSPQLGNHRDLLVYLPPSYASSEQRYPVLYMHDGQNLFDSARSYAGEWHVDETLEQLSHEGLEAIVVGLPNAGEARLDEYGPFHDPRIGKGGRGDAYFDFLVDTVKPLIDTQFRTLPAREHTGVAGSSMGGLISLYALVRYPQVFGLIGAFSPALFFGGGALFELIERAPYSPALVYIDVGGHEVVARPGGRSETFSQRYVENARRMCDSLLYKGFRMGVNLLYVEEPEGRHNEADWARRLPGALRFLLKRQ